MRVLVWILVATMAIVTIIYNLQMKVLLKLLYLLPRKHYGEIFYPIFVRFRRSRFSKRFSPYKDFLRLFVKMRIDE